VQVVRKQSAAHAGISSLPLQPVEYQANRALEGGGNGYKMESGKMGACANH
jgi:hypothetical protein